MHFTEQERSDPSIQSTLASLQTPSRPMISTKVLSSLVVACSLMATALGCDGHDEQEAKEFPTCEQAIAETLQHQTASEQSCGAAHPNCTCSEGEGGTGTLEVYCPDVERRCMGSVCGTQDPRGYYDRDAQNHTLASFNYMWAYDGSVREEMLVYALFPNSTCLFGIAENLYSENLTMMCTCQWVPSCGSKNNTHGFISVDCSNYESGAVADQCNETNFGIKPGSVLDGLAVAWNDGCEKTANANTKPPTSSSSSRYSSWIGWWDGLFWAGLFALSY